MQFSPDLAVAHRESLGLSRRGAARVIGLSRQGLINIEDGESVPSVATLARMATAYARTPDDFFHGVDVGTSNGARGKAPETSTAPTDASQRSPVGA